MSRVDGVELRDQIAEDYQRNAKRLGSNLTVEEARALAKDDLELVDRHDAEAKPKPVIKTTTEIEPRDEPDAAAVMAHDSGGKFVKRDVSNEKARPLLSVHDIRREVGEKAFAMLARFEQMLMRGPGGNLRDPEKIDWLHPHLAKQAVQIHANFTFKRGQYKGLNSRDSQRKFWRDVENLCDRSTATMGAWWVK